MVEIVEDRAQPQGSVFAVSEPPLLESVAEIDEYHRSCTEEAVSTEDLDPADTSEEVSFDHWEWGRARKVVLAVNNLVVV